MSGEVADKLQIAGIKWWLLRVSRHRDDSERRFVCNQRDDDRRSLTHVGKTFDRVLEGVGDQRNAASRHTSRGRAVDRNPLTNDLGGISTCRGRNDERVYLRSGKARLAGNQEDRLLGLSQRQRAIHDQLQRSSLWITRQQSG